MKMTKSKYITKNKKASLAPNISIVTLNVNDLNITKRQRLAERIKKYTTICNL